MATELDYYVVLGVERSATDAEIKKAFRKLAQQWHPDVNTEPGAQERFKEINEAYQVLSDPQRRQTLRHVRRGGARRRRAAPGFDPGGFGSFSDIFDAFFGGAAAGGAGAATRPPARTSATTSGSRSRRRSAATEKEIEFPVYGRCETCDGQRRQAGHPAGRLRQLRRPWRDPDDPPDDARPDGQRHAPARSARARARSSTEPCETCHGEGRTERKRTLRVIDPGRASTRATRSGCRTRARSASAAARPARCTSRSTSRPTRGSGARAPS